MIVGKSAAYAPFQFCASVVVISGVMGAMALSPPANSDLPQLRAEYSRLANRQAHARQCVEAFAERNPDDIEGRVTIQQTAGYLTPEENLRMLWLQTRIEALESKAGR